MRRRKHDDNLTAREWEVLELVREGLTNEQIAERLGVSFATAKYHVGEILSKLGVSSRKEAADWQPSRHWGFGLVPLLGSIRHKPLIMTFRLIAAGSIAATLTGLLLLALGLFLDESPGEDSPLGRLAYVQDGDIWVRSLPDGQPERLTTEGLYCCPRWSPSGEWLLVGPVGSPSARSATVMRADGSERRFAQGCGAWSPVEDVLVCPSYDDVRLETPEGAVTQQFDLTSLITESGGLPFKPLLIWAECSFWSRGGRDLACDVAAWDPPAELTLYTGNLTTEEETQIRNSVPRYSGIWGLSLDGTAWEIFGVDTAEGAEGNAGVPYWLPGDEAIQFQVWPSSDEGYDGVFSTYTLDLSGGPPEEQDRSFVPMPIHGSPYRGYGDDGGTLYTAGTGRETWTNKRIARYDLATNSVEYLTGTETAAISPSLSPDSQAIVYVAAPDAGQIEGVEDLLAGEPNSLSPAAEAVRQALAHRNLWSMDAGGSNQRPLTDDNRYRDENPQWSPDGKHILFGRIDAEGSTSVWLLPVAGGSPFKVADVSTCDRTNPLPSGTVLCVFASSPDFRRAAGPFWFSYYGATLWYWMYDWWQPGAEPVEGS